MDNQSLAQVLSPTTKQSLADEVAERLRSAILEGQLPPEQPLREAELSEAMAVSRGPVREALSRLELEGLIVVGPTGRKHVARLSQQDLDEIFSLRRALERLAIEYACANATPKDRADMQVVVEAMAKAFERGISEKEAAELDLRFHELVFRSSQHQRLLDSWTTLRPQVYVLMLGRNVASADFRELAERGHQEILDAIGAGDTERALHVVDEHMRVGYDHVVRSYQRHSLGDTQYVHPMAQVWTGGDGRGEP